MLAMAATAKSTDNSAFQNVRDASRDLPGADGRVAGSLAHGIASLLPQAANLAATAADVPAPAPAQADTSLLAAGGLGEDAATSHDPSLLGVSSDDGAHGGPSAPCPTRKRGRPLSRGVEDDDKALTVQERNRQAQARFRQRQKVRHAVEGQAVFTLFVFDPTPQLPPNWAPTRGAVRPVGCQDSYPVATNRSNGRVTRSRAAALSLFTSRADHRTKCRCWTRK